MSHSPLYQSCYSCCKDLGHYLSCSTGVWLSLGLWTDDSCISKFKDRSDEVLGVSVMNPWHLTCVSSRQEPGRVMGREPSSIGGTAWNFLYHTWCYLLQQNNQEKSEAVEYFLNPIKGWINACCYLDILIQFRNPFEALVPSECDIRLRITRKMEFGRILWSWSPLKTFGALWHQIEDNQNNGVWKNTIILWFLVLIYLRTGISSGSFWTSYKS